MSDLHHDSAKDGLHCGTQQSMVESQMTVIEYVASKMNQLPIASLGPNAPLNHPVQPVLSPVGPRRRLQSKEQLLGQRCWPIAYHAEHSG